MGRRSSAVAVAAALGIWSAASGCSSQMDGSMGRGGASGAASSGGSGGASCVPRAGTGGSGSIPPTFATVKLVLGGGGPIMPCASAPCHAGGGMAPPSNPLTLQDTPALYANLTSYVARDCGNMKLVNPGKPQESALLQILKGPCGAVPRMPYMCSDAACIPDDYIAAISQWIAICAPER